MTAISDITQEIRKSNTGKKSVMLNGHTRLRAHHRVKSKRREHEKNPCRYIQGHRSKRVYIAKVFTINSGDGVTVPSLLLFYTQKEWVNLTMQVPISGICKN